MVSVGAVIFDLDGTLVDHVTAASAAVRRWLAARGIAATDDLIAEWLFAAERRHFPAWRSGEVTFAEQRRRRLRQFLPLLNVVAGSDEELDETFADISCTTRRSGWPFRTLHGIRSLAYLREQVSRVTNR